jgi:oligopeptide transport system substrate-binding protein
MFSRFGLHTILGLLCLAVFFVGCSSKSEPQTSNTLRIGNGAEPNSLDPHVATTIAEAHIVNALFEGLIAASPHNDKDIVPGVASNWETNETFTRFTFTLRSDAKWSDGTPVVSQDFLNTYERLLNPNFGAANAAFLYDLKNAKAYNEGSLSNFEEVGVATPDPQTLVLTLENPTLHFLQKLKHWSWRPIHRPSIEASGGYHDIANNWATHAQFVSNGPYSLENWRRNERIVLIENPHYWDAQNVSISSLHFYPFENTQTEFRAFQSGQLDITEEIPSEQMGRNPESERNDPALATTYLLLNNESPRLDDIRLRQALSQAIDRKLLIRAIEKSGLPATRFTPGSMPDYEAADFATNDQPEKVILTEPLQFLVSNRESSIALAEAMQEMWQRKLGIEIRIQNMEFKSLLARLDAGDYDLSYLAWHGDYIDPMAFLEIWQSDSHFNRARWKEPRFDALIKAATKTADPVDRFAKLAEAETLLGKELPIIPIFWKTKDYLISPKVKQWPASLIDLRSYKGIKLSQ